MPTTSRWIGCLLLAFGLGSCDGIKTKLGGWIKQAMPEPAASPASGGADAPARPAASAGAEVRAVSEADFDAFVATPGHLVMVDFYADWCGPCRQLAPVLESLAAEYGGKLVLGKVNVDQNGALAARHGVRSIPDVRIYKEGKQVDRFTGAMPANLIRAMIDRHLATVTSPPPAPAPPAATNPAPSPAAPVAPPAPGAPDPAAPPAPPQPKPLTTPMSKDWMPPGIQRR